MATKSEQRGGSQYLEQVDSHAQFLMQSVLNGVLQQLERIERVVECVNRKEAMKRNKVGDRNHITAEDNYGALKTKLIAFSTMHKAFGGSFQESATDRVCEWIARRPEVQCSEKFAQAMLDTLDACQGQYDPAVSHVEMTEEKLQECSQRLAEAAHHWHIKEAKFNEDPEAAANKTEMYKIKANEQGTHDAMEVRAMIEDFARDEESIRPQLPIHASSPAIDASTEGEAMEVEEEEHPLSTSMKREKASYTKQKMNKPSAKYFSTIQSDRLDDFTDEYKREQENAKQRQEEDEEQQMRDEETERISSQPVE